MTSILDLILARVRSGSGSGLFRGRFGSFRVRFGPFGSTLKPVQIWFSCGSGQVWTFLGPILGPVLDPVLGPGLGSVLGHF